MPRIQTDIPEEDYERLQEIVEQRGLSIQQAIQEAMKVWLREQAIVTPDDALFTSVKDCRDGNRRDEQTNVLEADDIVEDWEGDPKTVSLADPEE
ncbi:hypothetical protein [Salinibaculum rarum]|uniref:hypothetical protein n=1 Tax=Salinibaculum rarum TaxID=3058903 RepID=UPI00265F7E2C|nr:hypothetical protein [Salinibaculum sp. KK48]